MSRKDMKPLVCRRQWVWGISDVWTNPDGPAGCGGSQNDGEMVIREVCGDGRSIRLVDMLFYDILAPWSACDACGRMVNQGPKTYFFHVWRIVFFHTQPAILKSDDVIYSIGKYAKSTKGWYTVLFFFHRWHIIYGFGLSMAMTFRLSFKHWVKQHLSTDSQLSDLVFGLFSRFCIIFSPNPHPPPSFARSPGPSEKTDGCCQKAAATAGGSSKIVQGEQKSIPDFLEIFPGSQMFSDVFFLLALGWNYAVLGNAASDWGFKMFQVQKSRMM